MDEEIKKSMFILLRPLVQINFILGTCPCLINPEGKIRTPYKYFNFGRFFLVVLVLFFFSLSSLLRAFSNLYFKNYADIPIRFSNKTDHGTSLAVFVDMACGFYVNLIPATFLCIASFKRKEILIFFDTMSKYVNVITGFEDYDHIKRIVKRLYLMHGSISLVMTALVTNRFFSDTQSGPGNMALWFFHGVNPRLVLWITAPITMYLSFAKAGVTAFIEVSCVALACCFCKVIANVQEYLNDMMKNWNVRFLEMPLTTSVLHPPPQEKDQGKSRKMKTDFENYLEQTRQIYKSGGYPNSAFDGTMRPDFTNRELTPGQQIINVIYKFQAVRSMQSASNSLFGCLLAINTGLMVFISVVLKYMLIWNFGNLVNYNPDKNLTLPSQEGNQQLFLAANSMSMWIVFALYDFCFMIRLVVLVICLGNVHWASQAFNSRLSYALLQVQKVGDVLEEQGMSNKYFEGRKVITLNELNTSLAFITENSANPMAFSAAGLFCFSRSLILVIISIIITYLVFLLQV